MKLLERLGINDAAGASAVAFHEYLSNRSAALLLRGDPERLKIGSAIAIQIGHYSLLATAAHNVKGLNPLQIEVIPAGRLDAPRLPASRIGIHRLSETEKVDVAWIELDIRTCDKPRISHVRLDQIGVLSPTSEPQACFVQGYPAEVVVRPSSPAESPLVESDGFLTLPIPSSRRRTPHQPNVDIAVEYPPHDGSLDSSGVPDPPGISGGGFWLFPRFENCLIWAPDKARLIGIARGWWRKEKEFLATRMEHWLEMVAEDFPDIRTEVRDTQARLRESCPCKAGNRQEGEDAETDSGKNSEC